MSATNRGTRREPNDFYATPTWLTEAIIPHLRRYQPQTILEPAAGTGAIARVLWRAFPDAEVVEGDITTGQDFMTHDYLMKFDLIITNPPYGLAMKFVKRALQLRAAGGAVAMLLRLNWLGSQSRAAWLRENTPLVYVTPRRPDFTGHGGDATEYSWMIWDSSSPPMITILSTEECAGQLKLC